MKHVGQIDGTIKKYPEKDNQQTSMDVANHDKVELDVMHVCYEYCYSLLVKQQTRLFRSKYLA